MKLTFSGSQTEDVTVFLQRIQENALAQGRQRDDAWTADCAAASLQGAALMWYSEQDDETQYSWKRLRREMLARWYLDNNQALKPLATAVDPQGKVVYTAPHLTTVRAGNLAAANWSPSELHGLRIYIPVRKGVQEFGQGDAKDGYPTWWTGPLLESPVEVSETAPIAAESSYGRAYSGQGRMAVYFVSRDNHLRAHRYAGGWLLTDLDVAIEGPCTGLAVMWHKDDRNSVWSVCYSTEHTVHLLQETHDYHGNRISKTHKSFPARSNNFGTVSATLNDRLGNFVTEFSATPLHAALQTPAHIGKRCIAATSLEDCGRGIQVYVMENRSIGLYELTKRDGEFTGPSYLLPEGYVSPESAISVAALRAPRLRIFVFFLYSENKVGYCVYDEGSDQGWQHGIRAVQT